MNPGCTIQIPVPKQHYYNNNNVQQQQPQPMPMNPNPVPVSLHHNPNASNVQNPVQPINNCNTTQSNNAMHQPQHHHHLQQQQPGQMPSNMDMNANNSFRVAQQQHNSLQYHHTNQQHNQHGFPMDPQQPQMHQQMTTQQQLHPNSSTLDIHPNVVLGGVMDIEIDDRPHSCEICHATYKTRTHLRRHMFIHLQERPYPCPDCSKGFNRKEHLNKHLDAVHSGTRYKCEYCGKEISRKDHLARHIKNMHNADLSESMLEAQMVMPIQSGSTMATQKRLGKEIHADSMDDGGDGMHFMTGSSFSTLPKLSPPRVPKLHNNQQISIIDQLKYTNDLLAAEEGNKRMLLQIFTCHECGATFTLEKDLNIHSRVHKPQPYKCNLCPRAYTRREKLTEHIRCFHQGQKFRCEYCDKQLSRKDHVLRHVRSVHPEVLANRFVTISENGGTDFTSKRGSENGKGERNSRPTGGNTSQVNNSNLPPSMGDMGILLRSVCHVCLKVFGTSYHLQRHLESCHNGDVRPFSCSFCKKQFKRKDHLTKHIKSHCPTIKDVQNPHPKTTSNTPKKPKATTHKVDSELSTINQETMNSLQIEMTTPDEDVEVALAIVNSQSNKGLNSTKDLPIIPTSVISTSSSSGMIITATTMIAKPPNSSSTYTHNLNQIINSTNKKSKKSSASKSSSENKNRGDHACGHCQQKFTTKDKMVQHIQLHHPSVSTSSNTIPSTNSTSTGTNTEVCSTSGGSSTSSSSSGMPIVTTVAGIIGMINSTKDLPSNPNLWS